ELLGVLSALPQPLRIVREPRTGFFDRTGLYTQIDKLPELGNALAIHDVELDLLERRSELVLDHLDARLIANGLLPVFHRTYAANIEPHGGIEFQRVAACGRLRRPEHDADLHAYLIDEDDHGVGA